MAIFERAYNLLNSEFLPYLRAPNKKPLKTQISEIRALWRSYRCLPYQYFKHRLYERSASADVMSYFPPEVVKRFQKRVNPIEHKALFQDKR